MTDIKKVFSDPVEITKLDKNELIELYEVTNGLLAELKAQMEAVRLNLLAQIKGNGEVIGDWAITRVRKLKFTIDIEKARELGATKVVPAKETIDHYALKELYSKGIDIDHTVTEHPLFKKVSG